MYIKSHLSPFVRLDLNVNCNNYDSLWVEVTSNNIKYIVGGYYRHPNTSITEFINSFESTIKLLNKHKNCTIIGDFNIDLNKYSEEPLCSKYVDCLFDN